MKGDKPLTSQGYSKEFPFMTTVAPVTTLQPDNDTLNELGPLPGSFRNSTYYNVKRIAMEGSVNEVPNFYKRYGKFPHQNRASDQKQFQPTPITPHSSPVTPSFQSSSSERTLHSYNPGLTPNTFRSSKRSQFSEEVLQFSDRIESEESQLENEIITPDSKYNSSRPSERLSMRQMPF